MASGDLLESRTADIDISSIEELEIQGYIGGFNLAFIRDLCGGTDSLLLGGRHLRILNLKKAFFDKGQEVYYSRDGEDLVIKRNNEIPSYAFEGCYVLNSIVLPDIIGGWITINKRAFANCILLKKIEWGGHISRIKEEAFLNCYSIEDDIILPEGLKEIGNRAFRNTHVVNIVIPSTVKNIGSCVFTDIIGDVVINAEIPPNIKIDTFVFSKSSNRRLYVPLKYIEKYMVEPYISVFKEIKAIESSRIDAAVG